jgi:hypothetical protein
MTNRQPRGYSREFTPIDRSKAKGYFLPDIPAAFWIAVRARARREGVSMRALILRLLTDWMATDEK